MINIVSFNKDQLISDIIRLKEVIFYDFLHHIHRNIIHIQNLFSMFEKYIKVSHEQKIQELNLLIKVVNERIT